MKELLSNVGSGGGGPAQGVVGGGGGATGAAAAAEEEKKEEKKEEEKEESDDDMVCSLPFACNDFCLTYKLSRASVFSINLPEPHSYTPEGVRMYLYSSCTFSVTCNLIQPHSIDRESFVHWGVRDANIYCLQDHRSTVLSLVYTAFFVDAFAANLLFSLSWEPALLSTRSSS